MAVRACYIKGFQQGRKGMRLKGNGLTRKGKRPSPASTPGAIDALAIPTKTPTSNGLAFLHRRHGKRADATGVGRRPAVHSAPAETAGAHLATHLALAQAFRFTLLGSAATLCRAGPAVSCVGSASPCVSRGDAGPRPGNRRVCAQTAAVVPATQWHHTRGPGRAGRSLDRRHSLRRAAA